MVNFIGTNNNAIYLKVLNELLNNPVSKFDIGDVSHEIIGFNTWFYATGTIDGISKTYAENEINWYMSQDNNIKGHKGIETNTVWNNCASDEGYVNSNYGWCVLSKENGNQLEHVLEHFKSNHKTRQSIMVYTRPSIHTEAFDNIHAKYDMTCTCYVDYLIRDNKLYSLVHMRSNDVWYGLRYDLIWQQRMLNEVYTRLASEPNFENLVLGGIKWHADSLHLYEKSIPSVIQYISDQSIRK